MRAQRGDRYGNKYTPDLLEYLAFRIGAMYLSDLHNERYAYRLQPILCGMEIEHYSLKDWEDAIHYITGKKMRFCSYEQVNHFLREHYFEALS